MREHSRSGDASSTSMTSKPSREQPGVSWRKKERAALKRASLNYLRLSPGSQGCISPPDHVRIFVRPLYSSHRLRPLDVQEPHYIRPLLPSCLSHRWRRSTFSLGGSAQDAPSNKSLISHRDRFSELCPCDLFSPMRSASSLPTALGILRF